VDRYVEVPVEKVVEKFREVKFVLMLMNVVVSVPLLVPFA